MIERTLMEALDLSNSKPRSVLDEFAREYPKLTVAEAVLHFVTQDQNGRQLLLELIDAIDLDHGVDKFEFASFIGQELLSHCANGYDDNAILMVVLAVNLEAVERGRLLYRYMFVLCVAPLMAELLSKQRCDLLDVIFLRLGVDDVRMCKLLLEYLCIRDGLPKAGAVEEDIVDCIYSAGIGAITAGNYKDAEGILLSVIVCGIERLRAWAALGDAYVGIGNIAGAEVSYSIALKWKADDVPSLLSLGELYIQTFRVETALPLFAKAVELQPESFIALDAYANCLRMQGRFREAAESLRRALIINPELENGLLDLAKLLVMAGEYADAEILLRKYIKEFPGVAAGYWRLGELFDAQGRYQDALEYYRDAFLKGNDLPGAAMHMAFRQLELGNVMSGWYAYRWRELCDRRGNWRDFGVPVWTGESLIGRCIVVWCEQGVADEVWFASLLPELVSIAKKVIFECDARLVNIFSRSLPEVTVIAREKAEALPGGLHVDYQVSLMDLPFYFRTDLKEFDDHPYAYLEADENLISYWNKRIYRNDNRICVGISWRSVRSRWLETGSSYPTLAAVANILRIPNIRWINLQYEEWDCELSELERLSGVKIETLDGLDRFNDIENQAAVMMCLDAIVAPSNMPAVLAAALGRPVGCIWSKTAPALWRALGKDYMPWFKSMKLFTKESSRSWEEALAHLYDWLPRREGERMHGLDEIRSVEMECGAPLVELSFEMQRAIFVRTLLFELVGGLSIKVGNFEDAIAYSKAAISTHGISEYTLWLLLKGISGISPEFRLRHWEFALRKISAPDAAAAFSDVFKRRIGQRLQEALVSPDALSGDFIRNIFGDNNENFPFV